MGVDLRLYFPPQTRLGDVAQVAGTLLGHPTKFVKHEKYSACEVRGVEETPGTVVGLANIFFKGPDGERYAHLIYHFESDGHADHCATDGWHAILPRSTPLWIAVARRLVDFFGGDLTYQDCEGGVDYSAPPRRLTYPGDGKPWTDFEREKSEVKPLTRAEVKAAFQWAACNRADEQGPWPPYLPRRTRRGEP